MCNLERIVLSMTRESREAGKSLKKLIGDDLEVRARKIILHTASTFFC
jgi:DNA-binding ferritin-like protein (Dps family)